MILLPTISLLATAFVAGDERARVAEVAHARLVPEHTIQVTNAPPFYAPATLTIRAGEKVHWRSSGHSDTHSVREALHGTFALEIPPGGTVTHHFRRPGEYAYRCRYHPWMVGKVVVEPKRLAIEWQSVPENLRNARLVAGDAGVFLAGTGARPAVARLDRGRLVPLGTLDRPIDPEVRPGVGPDGSLWFAAGDALVQFSPVDARSIAHKGLPAKTALSALAPSGDGSVWFHDRVSRRIGRFTPDGATVQWSRVSDPITAIHASADGTVWLISHKGRVGRLARDEIAWTTVDAGAPLTVRAGGAWTLNAARTKILRLDDRGEVVEFTIPPGTANPALLVPASDGVWIAGQDGRIAQLTGGEIEEYATSPSTSGFQDAAAGGSAELWLLDAGGARVGHVAMEVRTLARLR